MYTVCVATYIPRFKLCSSLLCSITETVPYIKKIAIKEIYLLLCMHIIVPSMCMVNHVFEHLLFCIYM